MFSWAPAKLEQPFTRALVHLEQHLDWSALEGVTHGYCRLVSLL